MKIRDCLAGLLLKRLNVLFEFVFLGKVGLNIALCQEIPSFLCSGASAQLDTDGWDDGICKPGQYFIVADFPFLKFGISFHGTRFFTSDILPKPFSFQKIPKKHGPVIIIISIKFYSNRNFRCSHNKKKKIK
ncbi:hypothetical protein LguiB_021627 [Lonicera macranthoides]